MKKIGGLIFLFALGIGLLVYVNRQRKVIEATKERNQVVESTDVSVVSSSASTSSLNEFHLRILTEPDHADIFIDEQKVGASPYEVAIPAESKKMRVVAEGYESYSRQVPAAKDAEGDLVWKIQLKKTIIREEIAAKTFSRGILGPFLLQMKAVPYGDFNSSVMDEFKAVKAKFCKVQIGQKLWVRVLLGPFPSKPRALNELRLVQDKFPQAFFTQKQNCL